MHSLLEAVLSVGRELDLGQVLHRIVEAAVVLADAEYGALGVLDDRQRIARFLPVGIPDESARRIGPYPSGHGILGELIRHPRPLRLRDLAEHPASYGFPANHPPMRTFLGVPVRVRDQVFGNLYLTEKRGGAEFDADDEAVLTTLAVAAGVAIDNARMYHESRRREQWLEASGEITRTLLSGEAAGAVLSLVARHGLEAAQADSACVLLPCDGGGAEDALRVEVAEGAEADRLAGATVPVRTSLAGAAAAEGAPRAVPDIRTAEEGYAFPGLDTPHGPVVAVPMPSSSPGLTGALRLARHAGGPPFDAADVKLLASFAGQAALALEVARHRAEAEQLALLQDRDRIARDLHDLAIQRLFATGMTLQSAGRLIDRPEAAERVSHAVDDLDQTIKIIRSTIFGLRAQEGPGSGQSLRHQLTAAVNAGAQSLGFAPSLTLDGRIDTDVPRPLGDHLLAVLGEALSNAARHAGAGRVDVAVTVADEVVLTVADDGVGIGSAPHTSGLVNMRARTEQVGGSLAVEPSRKDGTGTRVTWRAPLPPG
ncbi:GAF domain-containing protein [Streptomyces sp. SB3404]|uniref:GAF domain-containing protein n=2 Tax=Streptomyces boncukensis TaxID=2711219 RepID=A0A6G4WX33_9ACTN|nr:GAF domain-containing protein [Streptomyces boncukensis]NGO69190.1 GAF domain-containing protein [Streptomyces boncukensis]